MPDIRPIAPVDLLIDAENPRLPQPNIGQREALCALASYHPRKLLALAGHIVEHGLNLAALPIVTALGDDTRRYIVLEGNRRLAALKVLENPELVVGAIDASTLDELRRLSKKYQDGPIDSVNCLVVKSRDEARLWILLRHTGENEGAGVVPWASDDTARFRARSGDLEIHTQALNFLESRGELTPDQRRKIPASSYRRLLATPEVREKLGIEWVNAEMRLLGELCNQNVRDTLVQIHRIIVNRRWFQKDDAVRTSGVRLLDYQFTEIALYRSIGLHNGGTYTGRDTPLKNIFRNNVDPISDMLVIEIIRYLWQLEESEMDYRMSDRFTTRKILLTFMENHPQASEYIDSAINYMIQAELITEEETSADGLRHLMLLPRARCLYKMLQDSAIPMQLFRDDMYIANNDPNMCVPTSRLSDDSLWRALIAAYRQLFVAENKQLSYIKAKGINEQYKNAFGTMLLSSVAYAGLIHTSRAYFSVDQKPKHISDLLAELYTISTTNRALLGV